MSTPEWFFATQKQGLFELVSVVRRQIGGGGYSSETYKGVSRADLTDFICRKAISWGVIPFPRQVTTIQVFVPDRFFGDAKDDQLQVIYGRRSVVIATRSNTYGEVIGGAGCANIALEFMKELGLDPSQAQKTVFRGF